METFYVVLILLILSRIGGEVAERMKQPALAGELIAGVALGVLLNLQKDGFPMLQGLGDDKGFEVLTEFGMFFLMLLGGLELQASKLTQSSGRSFAVALGGLLLPLGLGFGVTWLWLAPSDVRFAQSFFIGTALAITAVPVSVKVLMDLGKLDSPLGNAIVGAALLDDILSLLLLAFLTGLLKTGGLPSLADIGLILAGAVAFLALTAVISMFVLQKLYEVLTRHARVEEFEFSTLLIVALGFAVLAELLGLHFILGPFVAGLFFRRRTVDEQVFEDVERKVSGVTSGFLAPLFFVSIGLHTDITALFEVPLFFALLLTIAFVAKLVGCGVPARLGGFSSQESLAIGVGMSGRGAVELIVADVALEAGLFSRPEPTPAIVEHMFGSIVLVAVITTIAVPIALRRLLAE